MLCVDFICFFLFFFDIVLVIALEGAICIQLTTLRCCIVVANNIATTGCSEGGLVCV